MFMEVRGRHVLDLTIQKLMVGRSKNKDEVASAKDSKEYKYKYICTYYGWDFVKK